VEHAKITYDVAESRVHVERDFVEMIGREGFLGSIFDEILGQISDETNTLLASVANTRHCTIQFVSETLTQKGTVKKEIKPVVTINGHEAPLEAGLSGGMLSVVMLATDLALGSVISQRSGVCPGWIILDEVFDGLGAVEKDSAMEILQKYAQDRLVIIIDHTSELKGMFTQVIEVSYSDGDSWV
jgi:DNA repair exonuclease SbcCD ATPase subunit